MSDMTSKLKNKRYLPFIFLIILIIVSIFFLSRPRQTLNNSKNVTDIVERVGKLLVLPKGETPTMFEIADPKFLVDKEPFFIGAEKGDILLIYQKTGKAVIYNKIKNIIVNVGPLVNNK